MRIGDVVTAQDWPDEYPLMVVAIAGGRVAIGSPRWPVGANRPMDYSEIQTVNGVRVQFEAKQVHQKRRGRSAA
jgi:hypothetical protein